MRSACLLLAAAVGASAAWLPGPAGALAAVCDAPVSGADAADLLPTTHVPGTLSHVGPSACAAPGSFVSVAPPCPTGYVGPLPGVFCGPLVAGGGSARCSWTPVLGGPSALVVGYDLPNSPGGYDGSLAPDSGEDVVYVGSTMGAAGAFAVPNGAGAVGKLMAYPTNFGVGFSPEDVTLVSCF